MTLLFARGASDLREVHSRSIHGNDTPRPVDPGSTALQPLRAMVRKLVRRFTYARRARVLQRELEALGDTVLADLGIPRTEIPRHISQMRGRLRGAPRIQTVQGLSDYLLKDLAISVRRGDARVYTSVPLGVISTYGTPRRPANTPSYRKTA